MVRVVAVMMELHLVLLLLLPLLRSQKLINRLAMLWRWWHQLIDLMLFRQRLLLRSSTVLF